MVKKNVCFVISAQFQKRGRDYYIIKSSCLWQIGTVDTQLTMEKLNYGPIIRKCCIKTVHILMSSSRRPPRQSAKDVGSAALLKEYISKRLVFSGSLPSGIFYSRAPFVQLEWAVFSAGCLWDRWTGLTTALPFAFSNELSWDGPSLWP